MSGNMFITFTEPAIAGSSKLKGHEAQIEIHSWNYGCHQPASPIRSSAGGGTMEKVSQSPLNFTKYIDTASDDLLKMCWTGKHIGKAVLTAYRSSGDGGANQIGVQYLKIELESVIVQDFSISGAIGDLPIENVSLNYAKITFTYDPQDGGKGTPGGVQSIMYDGATNTIA